MNLSLITDRKFIDSIPIENLEIETDTGWKSISAIHKTVPYKKWYIMTELGKELYCADTHILFDDNFNEIYAKSLVPGVSRIRTIDGAEEVKDLVELSEEDNMYDVTVESEDHRYYTNGILSHNSSCTLDSIVYALYGKPFRKANKPNIINSINKGGLLVEIEFSIGEREYKVVRGMKPNIFEIYYNGSLINQDASAKDYQEYLERYILKVNYKSFINVVILGSARYSPFMQMSAADRRNIIEELLDLQIFSVMNGLMKDKISKVKESELQVNYNIDLTQEKIKLQKQNIIDLQKTNTDQIEKKKEEIEISYKQIDVLTKDISLIEKHIKILQNSIADKKKAEDRKFKLISFETKIEDSIKKIKKENKFYDTTDSCPTCKQLIDAEYKQIRITENDTRHNELKNGYEKLQVEVEKVQVRLNEIKTINQSIIDHQSEVVKINASILAIQKFIQKELESINSITDDSKNIESRNVALNELITELDKYTLEKEQISSDRKYYDFAGILLKDGGIKTRIIKQYLPVLNKLINMYLAKMNFFVNFNINENFEEVIKSRHRDDFQYTNFSEGEKLRIDLAILFAFRQVAKMKNSVNTNLFLMDEILDSSLDNDGIDSFLDLISTLDDKTNIVIISHKQEQMQDKFDRVLRFEKIKNFTKLKQVV